MSNLPDWKTIPTAERDRFLSDFCAQGLSARQISDKFQNCSRSAAIGRISRLKLRLKGGEARKGSAGRRKADAAPKEAKPAKKAAPKRTARVAEVVSWRGANNPHRNDLKARAAQRAASPGLSQALVAGTPIRPKEDASAVPEPLRIKLTELTDATCRWPHGHPFAEDFSFCGNRTNGKPPYCAYHNRLASVPATVRQRASLRSAERIS